MKTLVVVTLTMTALGCSSLSIAADDCRFTADRSATVAVGDAAQAKIVARAGKLEMQGRPDLNEVRIRGKACASGQDVLGRIELVAERRGNEIFIEAKLPELGRWFSNASLDLPIAGHRTGGDAERSTLRTPNTLAVADTDEACETDSVSRMRKYYRSASPPVR